MGEFDMMCERTVRKLKNEGHSHIKLYRIIYKYKVNMDDIMEMVDEIIFPELNHFHYKELIVKRNEWMVDCSDIVLCYIRRDHGGAYKMAKYAKKKGKDLVCL